MNSDLLQSEENINIKAEFHLIIYITPPNFLSVETCTCNKTLSVTYFLKLRCLYLSHSLLMIV